EPLPLRLRPELRLRDDVEREPPLVLREREPVLREREPPLVLRERELVLREREPPLVLRERELVLREREPPLVLRERELVLRERELVLLRRRLLPVRRSDAGISSVATALVSCGISFAR